MGHQHHSQVSSELMRFIALLGLGLELGSGLGLGLVTLGLRFLGLKQPRVRVRVSDIRVKIFRVKAT